MKVLNTKSLIKTVDNLNHALFLDLKWEKEAEDLAEWISSRLGKPGGYCGSFAMTESDWNRDFRLFTGEKITSKAGRAHVIAQESTRVLKLIEQQASTVIDACLRSEELLSERIFSSGESFNKDTGEYCCATCSVALWRCVESGAFHANHDAFKKGLKTLRENRKETGGWQRFPFYYTLLTLSEIGDKASLREIKYHIPSCERRFQRMPPPEDKYAKRKLELLQRVTGVFAQVT